MKKHVRTATFRGAHATGACAPQQKNLTQRMSPFPWGGFFMRVPWHFSLNPPRHGAIYPRVREASVDLRRRMPALLPVDRGMEVGHRGPGGLRMLADGGAPVPSNRAGSICARRAVGRGGRLRLLRRGSGIFGAGHVNMVWPLDAGALSQGAGLCAFGGGALQMGRRSPGSFFAARAARFPMMRG